MNAKLTEMAFVHCAAREQQLLQVIALNEKKMARVNFWAQQDGFEK